MPELASEKLVIMPPCRKRKPTTSKHSVEAKTRTKTADAFSVQPAEQRSSKKSKTDGADAFVQGDRATEPQEPLVAEEVRKMAKSSHGDDAKKTLRQVRAAVHWNQKLEELKAYEAEQGDCLVPRRYNLQLGGWVHTQRTQYKLLKKCLPCLITED